MKEIYEKFKSELLDSCAPFRVGFNEKTKKRRLFCRTGDFFLDNGRVNCYYYMKINIKCGG